MRFFVSLFVAAAVALAGALAISPAAQAYIYWADTTAGAIGRANLDGTGVTKGFITGGELPQAVAVDGTSVFWAQIAGTGAIGRASLDGSSAAQTFIGSAFAYQPNGVAVGNGYVYWSNSHGAIARASLASAGLGAGGSYVRDREIIGGLTNVDGVAVDATSLYFVNHQSIGRANLDGSGANPDFITGANNPTEIAVDGTYIYWANAGAGSDSGSIGRARLDGSGVDQTFISGRDVNGASVVNHPTGVAVSGGYVYWSNETARWIGRARVDRTGAIGNFVVGEYARGVAVDALGPSGGTTPAGTTLSVRFGVAGQQVLRDARSLRLSFTCTTACDASFAARVTAAGRLVTTWRGSKAAQAATPTPAVFRLSTRHLRALRTALRAGKRVRFTVSVLATDVASGATATLTRTWSVALPDAQTTRAEKAFAKLVSARYGDSGPVVSCRRVGRRRWTCSFEAYTGGGQLCTGEDAGTVQLVNGRYGAGLDRTKVICEEA